MLHGNDYYYYGLYIDAYYRMWPCGHVAADAVQVPVDNDLRANDTFWLVFFQLSASASHSLRILSAIIWFAFQLCH